MLSSTYFLIKNFVLCKFKIENPLYKNKNSHLRWQRFWRQHPRCWTRYQDPVLCQQSGVSFHISACLNRCEFQKCCLPGRRRAPVGKPPRKLWWIRIEWLLIVWSCWKKEKNLIHWNFLKTDTLIDTIVLLDSTVGIIPLLKIQPNTRK